VSGPWSAEVWRIASVALLGFLVGLLFERPGLFTALGLFSYAGWHLLQLYRLEHWLRTSRTLNPPEGWGIWGEVFHHIYGLQQRNRRRKHRLAGMLSQYQKATAAMPDATVVLGPNWVIQWFNEAATSLLDFKASQDVGQHIENLLRNPALGEFLAKGAKGTLEIPAPSDPRLTVSLRVVPYGDEMHLLIARDISERQRLEKMRRDFIGNVSHELRTPLTVIGGFLETLAEEAGQDSRWAKSIALMREQSLRMQNLIDDLLLLSRLENERQTSTPESVNVCNLLTAMQADAALSMAGKDHVIELECEPDVGLYGNERELYSAFNNLLVNAVRYTPPGGRILVRWYVTTEGAHLAVTDNGGGISPEHLPRITERFYRVDPGRSRESGGTGLGLAIVKHVLQNHDARLVIESALGHGSTFTCIFPPERVCPLPVSRLSGGSQELH
jgi:two-component system phosphate regulon sensor histidine kinase PhoR